MKYWWSRNHAVCKKLWLGEPLEPSRTINESSGGHKTTQCEKTTARGVSAFQENSIKDSKTLLIKTAGSVKNHQCRSPSEVVTKPRRAQTNQIVCFLNQQIINCNTGGQKTTQWAKKGVTKKSNLYKTLACERRTKQLEILVVTKPRSVQRNLAWRTS